MENTLDKIDMKVLPEEAIRIVMEFYLFLVERYKMSKVEKKKSDKEAVIEDLLPRKVRNFVPMKREDIHGTRGLSVPKTCAQNS